MRRIANAGKAIRDAVNDGDRLFEAHFRDDLAEWHLLCAAMDVLDDSSGALEVAESADLAPYSFESYLRLYGLLQAVVLQQDALLSIYELLTRQKYQPSPDSGWQEVRYVRNMVGGHPLDRRDRKRGVLRVFLSRREVSFRSVGVLVYQDSSGELVTERFALGEILDRYKIEALYVCELIVEATTTGPLVPAV